MSCNQIVKCLFENRTSNTRTKHGTSPLLWYNYMVGKDLIFSQLWWSLKSHKIFLVFFSFPVPPLPVFSRVKTGFCCDCCYYKVLILTKREKASVVLQLSHNSSNIISEFFWEHCLFLTLLRRLLRRNAHLPKWLKNTVTPNQHSHLVKMGFSVI